MKLARLEMVTRYAEERQALLHMIAVVSTPADTDSIMPPAPKFCITVDGVRLAEPMLALVRPVLLGELRAQIRRIDADLKGLGVEVEVEG